MSYSFIWYGFQTKLFLPIIKLKFFRQKNEFKINIFVTPNIVG